MKVERLSPKEAANYLGLSISTLARWRSGTKEWKGHENGPRYVVVKGRIWYRKDWLEEWEDSVWSCNRI